MPVQWRRRSILVRLGFLLIWVAILSAMCLALTAAMAQVPASRIVIRGCQLTEADYVLDRLAPEGGYTPAVLKHGAGRLDVSAERWLQDVQVEQYRLRAIVLTVTERKPIAQVNVAGKGYWLCDDGYLLKCDPVADKALIRGGAKRLLKIALPTAAEGWLPEAPALLEILACLEQSLPAAIGKVEIDSQGQYHLFDLSGFEILLGEPDQLRQKIGALPKALRLCEADKVDLLYLDARNPRVLYKKWKEAIRKDVM